MLHVIKLIKVKSQFAVMTSQLFLNMSLGLGRLGNHSPHQ